MSKITREEIKRLAELSSLNITDSEVELRLQELNTVLTYIAKMNEISDKAAKPLQIQEMANTTPIQEDIIEPSFALEKVIQNAPERQDFFFKVPRMLGE